MNVKQDGLYAWCARGTDDWHYFNDGQPVTRAQYEALFDARFGLRYNDDATRLAAPAQPVHAPAAPAPVAPPQPVRTLPQVPAVPPQRPAAPPQATRYAPPPVRAAAPAAPQPATPQLSPALSQWAEAHQIRINVEAALKQPGLTSEMRQRLRAIDRQAAELMLEASENAKPKMNEGRRRELLSLTKNGRAALKKAGTR